MQLSELWDGVSVNVLSLPQVLDATLVRAACMAGNQALERVHAHQVSRIALNERWYPSKHSLSIMQLTLFSCGMTMLLSQLQQLESSAALARAAPKPADRYLSDLALPCLHACPPLG